MEITRLLDWKKFTPVVITATLSYLVELGYINDQALAENWIRNRLSREPLGRARLKSELWRRGIDRSLVARVISENLDEDREQEMAMSAADKKARQYNARGIPPDEAWPKIAAFLDRKGFSGQVISRVGETYQTS